MPGTDTCIKIGGFVRAEMNFNANGSFNPFKVVNFDGRAYNQETTRVRGVATFDVRSQTEYGTLRSYMAIGEQVTNDGGGSGVDTYSHRIFIQWAGFTAGLAVSFFDFYSTPAYSNTTNVLGSDTGGGGIPVFAYTAQFGGGMSATISAEDTSVRRLSIDNGGVNDYAGRQWPDVVANLRIDQAWGSAQIMGAIHQVRSNVTASDDVGYAAGAGVKFNLPMIGKGDNIAAQVTYAKGALAYVGSGLGNFAIQEDGTLGIGNATDAVWTGTDLDLTEGWSVVAGYQHVWNPHWKTSLYGTYGKIMYSDEASLALSGATDGDWAFWQAGSRTVWSPVKNLDLSVDVMYNHLDTAFSTLGNEDKSWWQGMFRVQRNFYP